MGDSISSANTGKTGYHVSEIPLGLAQPVRLIVLGAGLSGLNVAYQVQKHMKNVDLQIYDKNGEVGGTWLENQYPGCACDIPSHNYQFTWNANPRWKSYYAAQSEILEYIKDTAAKFELRKYIKLGHEVIGARWVESESMWSVNVKDLESGVSFQDRCHFLISACGFLNKWKWPDITGLHSFKGILMHSAAFDKRASLEGKRIAVIGSGSSGIQVVAKLQPMAKHLVTLIRQPTWVTPGFASKFASKDGSNFDYTEEQKQKFADDPQAYLQYRKGVEHELNKRFWILHKHSAEQREARDWSASEMRRRLGQRADLADFIIPSFAVGCRRPTPGPGYLEALIAPNVTVVTGTQISKVTETEIIMANGQSFEVDAIICATGFDTSFMPRFPMIGRNGIWLKDVWKDRPTAYMSMSPADMPNYFMYTGPNAPVGHGSTVPIIEHITKYILKMIYKVQIERYSSFVPRKEAIDEFVEHADELIQRMVWTDKCRSWFKNGRETGPVTAMWPGSRIHWFHAMAEPRYEDWEWRKPAGVNRWAYLGNGFSVREEGNDLAWYLNDASDGYQSFVY